MGPSVNFLVILMSLPCIAAAGKNFAVLVAGANEWINYPAQSLVCHAYHTLSKAGIPDERLIVMMYDDIANNSKNPRPGTIIDRYNGSDVYAGVPKDYTGDEITKDVFLAVLRGDKAAVKRLIGRDGKVIESGPDDNVFVYYIDHGTTRFVVFPTGHHLTATELTDTLKQMHKDKKYKQLLIYLESCMSGSMFDGILPDDINVYATTAANTTEYAYQIYCEDPLYPFICLSSEYTCNWLRDTDKGNMKTESLETQFENTRANTKYSTPQEYGDKSIAKEVVATFFGNTNKGLQSIGKQPPCVPPESYDRIPVPMVKIATLKVQISRAPALSKERFELERKLEAELRLKGDTENLFLDIFKAAFESVLPESKISKIAFNKHYHKVRDNVCYEDAVDILFKMCPQVDLKLNPYTTDTVVSLLHACNSQSYKTVIHTVKHVAMKAKLCKI